MPITNARHRALMEWAIKNDPQIRELKRDLIARGFAIGVVGTSIGWIIGGLLWHFL